MLLLRAVELATLSLAVLIGCGERGASLSKTEMKVDHITAQREWDHNEAILAEAAEGTINTDSFQKSVLFFYELTGISVQGDGTPFGYLPNERTEDDLVRLQEWCRKHCDDIYWDESSKKVKRLPANGGG